MVDESLREFLEGLQAGGERWLVAVSGGGDSVGLLRLVCEAGVQDKVVVGCFNHGWGDFGDESAYFVAALAGELGVKVLVGQGRGRAVANAEAVAREARYAWFAEVCRTQGLAGVLVAHTRDDVVETFLMRAGKGSGLGGLAGMQADSAVMGVRVVRPLLGVRRGALRAYLEDLGQEWMEDPDNAAGGSQRARVRKLLPALEAAGITVDGLAASVAALGDADALVNAFVRVFELQETAGGVQFARNDLQEAGVELAARVLGRVIRLVIGPGEMIVRRSKRVALWQRILHDETGAATLGGAKFEWHATRVMVKKEKGA